MKLNFLLRGHIRNSFNDKRLLNMIEGLSSNYELSVYIHTWNIVQSSLSWKRIDEIKLSVDEDFVRSYFKNINNVIKVVFIEDDTKIKLHGNVEGFIGRTACPVRAWKNMYYGKFQLVNYVASATQAKEVAVQARLDVMSNQFSMCQKEIEKFIHTNSFDISRGGDEERMRFLRMHPFLGIDNIYMATVEDMQSFINYMYFDMDRILHVHRGTRHQEHISFHERKSIFKSL